MRAKHKITSTNSAALPYPLDMKDLVINVSWEYFLDILGSIGALAYYTSGRFSRLETNVEWLSDAVRDLTIRAENISSKRFETGSPISLTTAGYRHLEQSGLKAYIDRRKAALVRQLRASAPFDRYRIQDAAFRLLARVPFEDAFGRRLNAFAFRHGISTDLLRRVAAIYLSDIAAGRT